ncbi:Hypothetical predicted protein, partial [Paramuricea clavata]
MRNPFLFSRGRFISFTDAPEQIELVAKRNRIVAIKISALKQIMAAAAGGVAGGVAAALGSSSGESENIPRKVNNFICQILSKLDKNSITKREMKLCEAYCLLWHHRRLGTVNGRKTSIKLISCAYASVILDLWAAGKIDIEVRGKLTDECVQAVIK